MPEKRLQRCREAYDAMFSAHSMTRDDARAYLSKRCICGSHWSQAHAPECKFKPQPVEPTEDTPWAV